MSMETPPTETSDPPATTTTQPAQVQKTEVRDTRVVREPVGSSAHDRLGELIAIAILVVDAFLALDFVFRALAVGRDGFVQVVDRVGDALASPFAGIFKGHPRRGPHDLLGGADSHRRVHGRGSDPDPDRAPLDQPAPAQGHQFLNSHHRRPMERPVASTVIPFAAQSSTLGAGSG